MDPHLMSRRQRDEYMRALQLECKKLEDEEVRIRARLASLKIEQAAFAGFYILSDDILAYIIEDACIHDCEGCFNDFSRGHGWFPSLSPRTVCNISRRFRAVAQALPHIWQCIHINNRDLTSRYSAMLHLQWSQDLPLSIMLDFSLPDPEPRSRSPPSPSSSSSSFDSATDSESESRAQDGIRKSFDHVHDEWLAVCEESYRWEYLCIPVGVLDIEDERHGPELNLRALERMSMNRDILTKLRLPFSPIYQNQQQASRLSNLTTLMIHRPRYNHSATSIPLEVWRRLLNAVPNLEVLRASEVRVDHANTTSSTSIPPGPITLLKLRFASFRPLPSTPNHEPNAQQVVPPFILAPALRTVQLEHVASDDLEHLFLGLEFRHAKHLCVYVGGHDRDPSKFRWLLSLLPELTSLHIYNICSRDEHDKIVAALSDASILPHLDTFTVGPSLALPELEDYVRARINAKHPLKKLRVANRSTPRSEIDAVLGGLVVVEYFDFTTEAQRIWYLAYLHEYNGRWC